VADAHEANMLAIRRDFPPDSEHALSYSSREFSAHAIGAAIRALPDAPGDQPRGG
jgi:hypothetical protein